MIPKFEILELETKQHNFTLKVNGYFLHSKYDPEKEARQFVDKNYKPNHITILFGYGKGYFAKALMDRKETKEKVIVIEPLKIPKVEVIEKSIDYVYIQDTNEEAIKSLLIEELNIYSNINIICSPNYNNLFPELYLELLTMIKERVSINRIMENTMRRYASDWQKNYIFNLGNAFNDQSLSHLYKKYTCPIVIVSGGPSLTKQIEQLRLVQDKVVIIAAGSTINTLINFNIVPDYVISIDGGMPNYNHFKGLFFKESKLIYSMYNHHQIRESFNYPSFYFLSADANNLCTHMKSVLKTDFPIITGGGSVANYALAIGLYITQGPITFIGQDLAYTDKKTHAEHNKSFSIVDDAYIKKRDLFLAKGYFGEDVLTDYAFYTMKEDFEGMIKSNGLQGLVFNSTEGGIFLDGFTQITFKEFCTTYIDQNYIKNTEINSVEIPQKTSVKLFIDQIKEEVQTYDKIKILLNDSLSALLKNKNNISFSKDVLKKIDKNDVKLEKLYKIVPLSSILAPITMDVMKKYSPTANETDMEKFNRVYEQNTTLYKRLLEVTNISQQYTNDLIKKFQQKLEMSE